MNCESTDSGISHLRWRGSTVGRAFVLYLTDGEINPPNPNMVPQTLKESPPEHKT